MKLIPLDFMGAGRSFYLMRKKSQQASQLVKEFIKTLKNPPA